MKQKRLGIKVMILIYINKILKNLLVLKRISQLSFMIFHKCFKNLIPNLQKIYD